MYKRIDHVQIAAPPNSEDEARKFFVDILKMREIAKPENLKKRGGIWLECGDHQLHIGIQEDFVPATKAHPAFCVEQIMLLRETLVKNNIQVKDDEPLEGAIRFYTNDPFGNRLEFIQWQ